MVSEIAAIDKLTKLQLDQKIIAAHQTDDTEQLIDLYGFAGKTALSENDKDAARFYLTYAYVFGLETGHRDTSELRGLLVELGSEI